MCFLIGVAPRRIDFFTKIDGVDFGEAYEDKEEIELEGLMIPILSKRHLIQNKEATGREKEDQLKIWWRPLMPKEIDEDEPCRYW